MTEECNKYNATAVIYDTTFFMQNIVDGEKKIAETVGFSLLGYSLNKAFVRVEFQTFEMCMSVFKHILFPVNGRN